MYDLVLKTMIRLKHDDDGATLVEYGIALGLAIALGAGAMTALGTGVSGSFSSAAGSLPS